MSVIKLWQNPPPCPPNVIKEGRPPLDCEKPLPKSEQTVPMPPLVDDGGF